MLPFEREILEECAGLREPRAWGAAVGAALEYLDGKGLTKRGVITERGSAYLAPSRALQDSAARFVLEMSKDSDKSVKEIADITRACMDDLGITPRRIDGELAATALPTPSPRPCDGEDVTEDKR